VTLEREWVEVKSSSYARGRDRGRSGYTARGGGRITGSWTAEKGFNRGLDKVRRWRESCEDGVGGANSEGFRQFAALVLGEYEFREGNHAQSQS
jgi:hypothetical protein